MRRLTNMVQEALDRETHLAATLLDALNFALNEGDWEPPEARVIQDEIGHWAWRAAQCQAEQARRLAGGAPQEDPPF